jgi:type IV pilus assembly protein PilQ
MILSRTLASSMLAAFGAIGSPAATVAHPAPNEATVVSLSVVPATGHANVVIRVDGAVTYKHFVLSKPDKIVVDLTNATLGVPAGDSYDGVARGGITRIRYSQFTKSVVRVVLTLDAAHTYDVTQQSGEVRVSIDGSAGKFAPWQVDGMAREPRSTTEEQQPAQQPAQKPAEKPSQQPAEKPSQQPAAQAAPEKREAAPAPAETESRGPNRAPRTVPPPQSQEPRISISWENAPINDVLAGFAAFTGRTILPSKNVTGTVTANVNNLPWDVALRKVMNAYGYDVTFDADGVVVVDTYESIAAHQATIPLATRTVRFNYARARGVLPMIETRLSRTCPQALSQLPSSPAGTQPPGGNVQVGTIQSLQCPQRGAVTADTITNSISITDIPSQLVELEQYARSLDLRQPQVNIKAKIILVDRSSLEALGLRYDLGTRQQFFNDITPRLDSTGHPLAGPGQILLGGNTISAIANATQRIPSAALQLVYSTAMGQFDFTTFLEALQTNTLLDVQAEPSASVLNNRTANLTAGTQVPIRVIDAGAGGNQSSNFPRAAVQFQQTGVILTVTPQITNNRQIQMKVHVENSDVQFQANDVGAVFPKQSVDNEVLVADGETAVMGGLTQTTVSVSKSGIPILVDLPIIGRLFGVTNRQETKRDLLILITPHIIDEGQSPETGRP